MGTWILRKHCGCPLIAIADGALFTDTTLAKVLTPILSQSARQVSHIDSDDPVTVYNTCPHDTKQLQFEETCHAELRARNPTPPDMLANLHSLDKYARDTHPSAAVQTVAADLQAKIDAHHDEANAMNAAADAADDALDAYAAKLAQASRDSDSASPEAAQ